MKPSHEANVAASRERARIVRYLQSLKHRDDVEDGELVDEIILWITGMPKRASRGSGEEANVEEV
jgi:hypothetical protein